MSKSLSQDFARLSALDIMLGGKWEAERIATGAAYLVDPNGARVARMGEARALGIAAALNTADGAKAYEQHVNEVAP